MRLPSLKHLKTFQIAAARLSFKAAAEEMFITPSAVSHQIRSLEQQLGMALFDRGPQSLTLTEAGENYLRHLDTVFARLEAVTEQLQIRFGRGVVRLHTPSFFATEMLLPKLPAFLAEQPDTDIHINTALAPLQSHPADSDLSIIVGSTPEQSHACHKLFSQTFVAACAPKLLQGTCISSVEDLNGQTLIEHDARRDGWHRWADSLGIKLRPRKLVRFDTMHAAAHAAEHGVGVALVSSRLGNERFEQGSLIKLFGTELETGESYYLVHRREDAHRPDIRALAQWILREFSASS